MGEGQISGLFYTTPLFLFETISKVLHRWDYIPAPESLASGSTRNTLGKGPETPPSWHQVERPKAAVHAGSAATTFTLWTNTARGSLGLHLKVLDPGQDLYTEEGHY